MNTNDRELFEFFQDAKNILSLKDNYSTPNSLSLLHNQVDKHLIEQTYSDINIQDESGNTFLHYTFVYNIDYYAHQLISLGANPFIKNNDGKNAFDLAFTKNYDFNKQFWTFYENNQLSDIPKISKKYHLEFKQDLFEVILQKNGSNIPLFDALSYLNKIELFTPENYINLIFASFNTSSSDYHSLFELLKFKRTPSQNSLVLYKLAHILNFKKNSISSENDQKNFEKFLSTSKFEYDVNFIRVFNTGFFMAKMDIPYYSKCIHFLLDYSIKNNFDVSKSMLLPYGKSINLQEFFDTNQTLNSLYLSKKLNQELHNKESSSLRNKI